MCTIPPSLLNPTLNRLCSLWGLRKHGIKKQTKYVSRTKVHFEIRNKKIPLYRSTVPPYDFYNCKVTHFSLRNIIEIIINCWNEYQIHIEFTVICLLLLLSLCCCLNTKLLTKIDEKRNKEEKNDRCTYLRVDLTHTYHTISRRKKKKKETYICILIYEYIILLFCSEIWRIYKLICYTRKMKWNFLYWLLIEHIPHECMYVLEFN